MLIIKSPGSTQRSLLLAHTVLLQYTGSSTKDSAQSQAHISSELLVKHRTRERAMKDVYWTEFSLTERTEIGFAQTMEKTRPGTVLMIKGVLW